MADDRLAKLLGDAVEFFENCLWEARSGRAAREALVAEELDEKVIRGFRIGYAPIGPDELMGHLRGLGYSADEQVAAGLATRSARGRPHAHFRSRVMFPVADPRGRVQGFAGLGTHLGPSWALWVTSPDGELYRRSAAVFAIDRARKAIAASGTAVVAKDCIEVLRAHGGGERNVVTVHTNWVTREQRRALAAGVSGGGGALELELPPGMSEEPARAPAAKAAPASSTIEPDDEVQPSRGVKLKRVAIVAATALAAINTWTGAPLLAVWVGSQVQPGRLLTMWGVLTVLVVMVVVAFLLGWALTWLSAKYDELTGRPALAGQTSPWHRAKRGDRVEDVRSRYGVSAPEKAVAICFVAAVLVLEIWFFFFAGSPFG